MGQIYKKKDKFELILKSLEKSFPKLIAFKKAKKTPFVVGKNGKVELIPASEMPKKIVYVR